MLDLFVEKISENYVDDVSHPICSSQQINLRLSARASDVDSNSTPTALLYSIGRGSSVGKVSAAYARERGLFPGCKDFQPIGIFCIIIELIRTVSHFTGKFILPSNSIKSVIGY